MADHWIGITLGDVTGIGPEVALKSMAAAKPGHTTVYVLIGDPEHARALNTRLGLNLRLENFPGRRALESQQSGSSTSGTVPESRVFLLDVAAEPLPQDLPPGAAAAANLAMAALYAGAERCLTGEFDALVTAPVNKEAIVNAGHRFIGQTELLTDLARRAVPPAVAGRPGGFPVSHRLGRTAMMLLGHDDRGRWLRVALATTHLPLKDVSSQLTRDKVLVAIELAAEACRDLALPRQRVAVCGLNPHAGEGGKMGTEEQTVIAPAVQEAVGRGLDVVGPLSADALCYYAFRGEYDAVVAMYHDQGLAPLKMVAFEHGVNWTLGLPFVRTSPDHGTAYDIAGQGRANPSSMLAAIRLARQLVARKRS